MRESSSYCPFRAISSLNLAAWFCRGLAISLIRSHLLVQRGRVRAFISSALWAKDRKTSDLLSLLSTLIKAQDEAVLDLTYSKLQEAWLSLSNIDGYLDEVREWLRRSRDRGRLAAIKTSSYDRVKSLYFRTTDDLVPETGKWLEQEPLYRDWMANKRRTLFVLCEAGTGKSYLATALIRKLQEVAQGNTVSNRAVLSVGYYYVTGQQEDPDTINDMLKTMAYQVQEKESSVREHILRELADDVSLFAPHDTWTHLLGGYWMPNVEDRRRLILVLDGLNEVSDRELDVLDRLLKIFLRSNNYAIQIAIFGRPSLRERLDLIGNRAFVEINASKNQHDLRCFVHTAMEENLVGHSLSDKRAEWEDKIVIKVQGVFEAARALTETIRRKQCEAIERIVDGPPEHLYEIYDKSLNAIVSDNDIDPHVLQALLTWLVYTGRPLRLGEIYEFLHIQTGLYHELLLYNLTVKLRALIECKLPL